MRRDLKIAVFDSYAVLALLFDEPGAAQVADLLAEASRDELVISISVMNWAEVKYRMLRRRGPAAWEQSRRHLYALPIEIVPADLALAEAAGEYKAAHKMSLADAFAAALAGQKKAQLVTGDPEFKAVERQIKITWLK
jgi:PIN domain nuclease of toxin-antitoxin system